MHFETNSHIEMTRQNGGGILFTNNRTTVTKTSRQTLKCSQQTDVDSSGHDLRYSESHRSRPERPFLSSGNILIMSSIRRIVIAASVANLRLLIFDIVGSKTPAFLLSRTTPFVRSRPTLRQESEQDRHALAYYDLTHQD